MWSRRALPLSHLPPSPSPRSLLHIYFIRLSLPKMSRLARDDATVRRTSANLHFNYVVTVCSECAPVSRNVVSILLLPVDLRIRHNVDGVAGFTTGRCRHCDVITLWFGVSKTADLKFCIRILNCYRQPNGCGQIRRNRIRRICHD